jgi:hypothetical protein
MFKYDDDPDWENVYISYHLQSHTLWERIKTAFNHILGKKSRYGDFGEIILGSDDTTIEKFEHIVDALKNIQRNQKIKEEKV